jgi:RNA polymerase sigma factor (sigma-70 family)
VTHSRHDAEDVVQTVFMNILRRPQQGELARNIEGFLYRAAVNEALFMRRTGERLRIDRILDTLENAAAPAPSGLDPGVLETLEAAMTKLKTEEVEILVLNYAYGYSDGEIAKMLRCSRVKVAVTLFRARRHLKKLVLEKKPEHPKMRRREGFRIEMPAGGEAR